MEQLEVAVLRHAMKFSFPKKPPLLERRFFGSDAWTWAFAVALLGILSPQIETQYPDPQVPLVTKVCGIMLHCLSGYTDTKCSWADTIPM